MGAMADAIKEYAQPLIDTTDGSLEQLNAALTLSQICWNLSISPAEHRERLLAETRTALGMDDDAFQEFLRSIAIPMMQRHIEMFPQMHGERLPPAAVAAAQPPARPQRIVNYPKTGRNAPCPCNSGRKYKHCCGR
jgi:hypothetical protein